MRSNRYDRIRYRLSAKFHRMFARQVRLEALSRKSQYQVGPFKRSRDSLTGWFDAADWLDQRAIELDARADKSREPRF